MSSRVLASVAIVSAGLCGSAFGQSCSGQWLPGFSVPGVNGTVNAMTLWDPDGDGPLPEMMVIGGRFSVVDKTLARNIAAWDGTNWIALGNGVSGASSNSGVNALAVYNDKLYVAGEFEQAGTLSTSNIASWNGSTWEALASGLTVTAGVNAMAVYHGELVVAGSFSITGGYQRIAKWNGAAWSILGASNVFDNTAWALAVFGDKLIVGGDFTKVVGNSANAIASWDGATWQGLGTGMNSGGSVRSLHAFENKLYAGGTFSTAGGVPSPFLARWTGDTWESAGAPFAAGPIAQSVNAMTESAGNLVVGGTLTNASCVFSYNGASWSAVGSMGSAVTSLQNYTGALYAGSQSSNAESGTGISVYQDGTWQPIAAGFNREIWTLTNYHGDLVIAGDISATPGGGAKTTARWDGATWSAMGSQTLLAPKSLRVHNDELYLGGAFTTPSAPARGIVQWNGTSWAALAAPLPTATLSSKVETLDEYQGKLLAAGALRISGPLYDAGFLWDGVSWQSLGAVLSLSGTVTSTAVYHGDLYIAGASLRLSTDPSSGSVLRYNGSTWSKVGTFGLSAFSSPTLLRVYQDKLYIASLQVTSAGGLSYGSIATWDGTTVAPLNPTFTGQAIAALTEYNGDLIIGGAFTNAFGVGANGVVRWNGTSFAALGQGIAGFSSTGRRVSSLDVHNGELIAVGDFDSAGGAASPYFARWTDNPTSWVAVSPESKPVNKGLTLTLNAAAASGYANVSYQWKRNGIAILNGSGGASSGGGTVSGSSGTLASPSDGSPVALTIAGVEASDAGNYTIEFNNTCNAATSDAAAITVNTCPGDLNFDGFVNDADFEIFVQAYNILLCDGEGMPLGCLADMNGDGVVDDADFQIFVVAYDELVCE